jgi:hypothetical protein
VCCAGASRSIRSIFRCLKKEAKWNERSKAERITAGWPRSFLNRRRLGCFFSIGLTTRLRSLTATGVKPFVAFTAGVAVNIAIGYALSAHVFAPYWNSLGQGS